MSTIKVNAIQHTTANASNMTLFANGNVAMTTANTTLTVGSTTISNSGISVGGNAINPLATGMRNRIINGDMRIWQRNTTFSLPSGTVTSANNYTSDRWMCYSGGSSPSHTVTRSTDVPSGFLYSLRNLRNNGATATGTVYTVQFIESVNCYDLSGQTATLSFWAKAGANYSATSSSLTVAVGTGTTADQGYSVLSGAGWAGYATPLSTSTAITTSWQKFTFTFTFGSNIQEAFVMFGNTTTGTAGADDSYYIAGVQLEVGTVATPFEFRHYGQELALCQRYYEKSYDVIVNPGTANNNGAEIQRPAGTEANFNVRYKVTKRTTPTVRGYSTTTGTIDRIRQIDGTSAPQDVTATVDSGSGRSGPNGCRVYGNIGAAQGFAEMHWTADAEL